MTKDDVHLREEYCVGRPHGEPHPEPAFRSLSAFAKWFMAQPLSALRPPGAAVYHYETKAGAVHGIVLYRKAPFQVELFSGVPGRVQGLDFPEHRHPNVDSIEVFLCGEVAFSLNGIASPFTEGLGELAADGASAKCGKRVRVRPTDWHSAVLGPESGAFLSIQHWLNGVEPTSVGLDWDGVDHISVAHGVLS